MFIDSVYRIVCPLTQLSLSSLANSQGPCLPLLKSQTIDSPFASSTLSSLHLSPPPLEFSGELVHQVISVPGMASIDLGLWIITHICHPALCLTQHSALLFVCFSLQVIVQTFVSIMDFILPIFKKIYCFDYGGISKY